MTLRLDKKYISLIFFIVFSTLLTALVIFPLLKKIQKSSRQLIEGKEQKFYFSLEKENLQKSKIIYDRITPDLEKTEDVFLVKKTPIELELIKFFEKIASDSDVSIKISSVSSENKGEDQLSILTLNLEASGSFNNFLNFIEKIENNYYLIEVVDLTIKKLNNNDISDENVIASVLLNVFKR